MQNYDILNIAGLRIDGRRNDEIRLMTCKLNHYTNVEGSCYLQQGLNKVLVLVHGPQEPIRRNDASNDEGSLTCMYINAPFSGLERKKRRNGDRKSQEIEKTIEDIFNVVIKLDLYPKSEIVIVTHLLESDGSAISAIINATTLALIDAGIAMSDIVACCTIGVIKDQIYLDLSQLEQSASAVHFPITILRKSEEVLFIQIDNKLSSDKLNDCLQQGILGCKKILTFIENSIKESMLQLLDIREKS